MELYFDNAASCRPFEWAVHLFSETVLSSYANQESAGALGIRAKRLVGEASKRLADAAAPGADVFWCNSGTEALAAAVRMHRQRVDAQRLLAGDWAAPGHPLIAGLVVVVVGR